MHPQDAAARGLTAGQLVCIRNSRGACRAELRISDAIRPGVIQIATGAWFEPDGETCQRGNPNTLTLHILKGVRLTLRRGFVPIHALCLV